MITDMDDLRISAVESKPTPFLQNAVRHVFFKSPDRTRKKTIENLLLRCSGIASLFIDGEIDSDLFAVLDQMHLRKLTFLLPPSPSEWLKSTLNRPVLLSVTHLELDTYSDDPPPRRDDWSQLTSLPALTHLCLTKNLAVDLLRPIIAECPRLTVVVTEFWHAGELEAAAKFAQSLAITDPRIVVMVVCNYKQDWRRGVRGGKDFCLQAEKFVARKRRGEINSACYFIEEDCTCR
ncbi:hypothetical protein MVEN_01972100 [Mycena venus]|uniref:Uncharacterized protein n=1 Tax=Mycena venus TaxID=2733690 RepID=A0A8H6XEF7_9AGAR|nr:hypothetical protein MVEN_01972100 [Mycena venus]